MARGKMPVPLLAVTALLAAAAPSLSDNNHLSSVAASPSCGICPTSGNETGAAGNFPATVLSVATKPVGNTWPTRTGFVMQGVTGADDEREFLVALGLVSNRGNHSRPTPYHDKVGLYVGVEARQGTGDVWSINPLLTQAPNSGDYNAQGIELDFNNENAHRGEADAGAGLAPPVSYGLSVTGAAPFRSTAAILVSGSGRLWNRGIVFANDCVQQSTFQDLGNGGKSIDIRGGPVFGVYQSSTGTKNFFAGKTGVGPGTEMPTATLHVGGDLHCDGRLVQTAAHPSDQGARIHRAAVLAPTGDATVVVSTGLQQLNSAGEACITLPASAVPAGASASVQLTPMGAAMPSLHVSGTGVTMATSQIPAGFCVKGGAAGHQVSWTVTANL